MVADTIFSCYIGWIMRRSLHPYDFSLPISETYINTQAKLIAELMGKSYKNVMDNYREWVRDGYKESTIQKLFI